MKTTFTISRFNNRSGATSWRVSGLLGSIRIRRNFKTREEAAAEKATLDIRVQQIDSGDQSVSTHLTESQVREAEAVFQRLADKPHPLAFYLDYALANYREPSARTPLDVAVQELCQSYPPNLSGEQGAPPKQGHRPAQAC